VSKKKVIVIGSGPGGLTAAMILASKGYDVDVFEKQPYVGGRNSSVQLGDFTFDMGPTFLMMKHILEEVFELAGRNVYDYMEIKSLDPLYRLRFGGETDFFPTRDRAWLKDQIETLFPGNFKGYRKYMEYEKGKYERLVPCLQIPYGRLTDYLKPQLIKALPILDAHISLFDHLGRYFRNDDLKIAFTFQAKYLGMSPWKCPATFSIISYIEHAGGVHHPIGGLNRMPKAMAKVVEEEGGRIHLGEGVEEVIVRSGKAIGVKLMSGESVYGDYVVLNADFAYAMNHLVPRENLRKWTPENLSKRPFSCSTFMIYLGVNRTYDVPHHNIIFADDYKANVEEIAEKYVLSENPSIYIQNACRTDPTLAPEGKSTIYILVPIANRRANVDWDEVRARYRDKVLEIAETRGGLTDLRKHIEKERIITPDDWENEMMVYRGATFNLAHGISQMLYMRPHNEFEEFENCYLVGGGTHPGSGLPTIMESGRISAGLIMKRDAWYL